jgi:predicted nuclease of predicted toxin-antitoxin system
MRLLFDQNLSFRLCRRIDDLFPGSTQVRLLGLERASDRAVWDYAKANALVLVTQDSDFAEMAALLGPPPKIIWLRSGNQPTDVIVRILRGGADAIIAFGQDPNGACLELY